MNSKNTKTHSNISHYVLSILMGLIVVISLNSITVQASSDDTTLSSMYKIDELIQNYGDKTPYIHTGNKTFTDAQLAEMVTDLERRWKRSRNMSQNGSTTI